MYGMVLVQITIFIFTSMIGWMMNMIYSILQLILRLLMGHKERFTVVMSGEEIQEVIVIMTPILEQISSMNQQDYSIILT